MCLTHTFTTTYIGRIIANNIPSTPDFISLYHRIENSIFNIAIEQLKSSSYIWLCLPCKRFDGIMNAYLLNWYSYDRNLPNFYTIMSSTMKKLFTKPLYMLKNYWDTIIYQLISLFELI